MNSKGSTTAGSFIPRAAPKGRRTPRRSGTPVQFICADEILDAFDEWWKGQGIASRTQALIWLMDDAAATNRKPPLLKTGED